MTRDDFFQRFKPRTETVNIGGEDFMIRSLTISEREQYEAILREHFDEDSRTVTSLEGAREHLIFCGMLKDDGTQFFATADRDKIAGLDSSAREISDAIARLSGLTGKGDAVKN